MTATYMKTRKTTLSMSGLLAAITKIANFGGGKKEMIDVTTFDSDYTDFKGGIVTGSELSIDIYYTAENASALAALLVKEDEETCTITFSDNSTLAFKALLSDFNFSGDDPKGYLKGTVKIQVTGNPFSAAA